jgi:soluble lytic murein transglycosylase
LPPPLPAQAGNTKTASAREAYRSNDIGKLTAIASAMPASYILHDYPSYWLTLKALDRDNDSQVVGFLNSARRLDARKIRNEWLKKLGKRRLGRFCR